jgi:radical SAM protein with 4Fe4S-binding SPASM domain
VFELTLTGGEIMLVKQVFSLIDFFNEVGITPHVTSNGTLVDDRRADELASRRVTFQVSIDSADASVHDGVRGRQGALRRALQGIERLIEREVPVSVAYTCMPQNVADAEGVVALADGLGVERVCVGEVLPHFGEEGVRESLEHGDGDLDAVALQLEDLRQRYAGRVDVSLAFQGLASATQEAGAIGCSALDRDLAILHDGHAYPCPFVRNPRYDLGSVLTTPIRQIWTDAVAAAFRQEKAGSAIPHCRVAAASPAGSLPMIAGAGGGCGGCGASPTNTKRNEVAR